MKGTLIMGDGDFAEVIEMMAKGKFSWQSPVYSSRHSQL